MNAFRNVFRPLLSKAAWFVCILIFVIAPVVAQTLPNEDDPTGDFTGVVENLAILNIVELREMDVVIAEEVFLPQFQGHFSIATLDFRETIGAGVTQFPVPPSGPNQVAWWDVVVQVTRSTPDVAEGRGVMISIDKDVTNNTNFRWSDFHMTVGRGTGANFEESDEFDNLFFKTDPAPVLEVPDNRFVDAFENPPEQDEPFAPDNLWWFAGDKKGQGPGERTDYWLALNVPASAFPDVNSGQNPTVTTITIRQHASIPEPSGAVLLLACGALVAAARRRFI